MVAARVGIRCSKQVGRAWRPISGDAPGFACMMMTTTTSARPDENSRRRLTTCHAGSSTRNPSILPERQILCDSRVEIVITTIICHAYHSDQGLTIKGTFWTLPSMGISRTPLPAITHAEAVILANFQRVYAEPFYFPIC